MKKTHFWILLFRVYHAAPDFYKCIRHFFVPFRFFLQDYEIVTLMSCYTKRRQPNKCLEGEGILRGEREHFYDICLDSSSSFCLHHLRSPLLQQQWKWPNNSHISAAPYVHKICCLRKPFSLSMTHTLLFEMARYTWCECSWLDERGGKNNNVNFTENAPNLVRPLQCGIEVLYLPAPLFLFLFFSSFFHFSLTIFKNAKINL